MKKIFSYCLFEPKHLPPHRTWDQWRFDNQRYWYNIPAIMIINQLIYPDYEVVFYVSKNILSNPLSKIFDCFENIKIEVVDRDYSYTEPAIWRMMPLWERGVSIFHPRDVDSLTNENEYKFIKSFENSECTVGTIRSHENHHGIACRMLAGLCSFKPNLIAPNIKGFNFDFYYSSKPEGYGSDQNLMIKIFTSDNNFTKKYFLDCKIEKQFNQQDFECIEADISTIEISVDKKQIFNKIKNHTKSSWLGEPCDSRGELLNFLLDTNPSIKNKISNIICLKQFYIK